MSPVWQAWERWLGNGTVAAGSGRVETTIQATWPAPVGIVGPVFIAIAALVWLVYWREYSSAGRGWRLVLATIRTLLMALVLWQLYGWTAQRHHTDRADVVIVIDNSTSMSIADSNDNASLLAETKQRLARLKLDHATRLNLAKVLLLEHDRALLTELERRYNVRCYLAGASARAVETDLSGDRSRLSAIIADQPSSRLGDSLCDVLEGQRGHRTAAVIFLTDGVTTEGKSLAAAAQDARRKTVPLYVVGLGSDRPPRDLRIADLLADETAFVGDWLNFEVSLAGEGFHGDAVLTLKRAGARETLAEQSVALDNPPTGQTVRLTHRADTAGEFEYVVEVTPQAGETKLDNNQLTRKVVVREEAIRVLLVQAYPSYEFRFLKQMLVRELNAGQADGGKAKGVRTVLQEADPAYVESDISALRTFPVNRDELFAYDVLIFGDVNPALLSPSMMNNIHEFVTVRGGGLVFIAGPRYTPLAYQGTPLAPLFPVQLNTVSVSEPHLPLTKEFRPRLTPLGLASPALQLADAPAGNERLWRDELPPLRWFVHAPDVHPGVRVLAEHPESRNADGTPLPLICLQFSGAGKVLFHATDETHRWRFRAGDVYFARYWVQAIRALCRAQRLAGNRAAELSTDRRSYRRGEAALIRVRFLDDRQAPADDTAVSIVLQSERGDRRTIALRRHVLDRGVFEGSTGPLGDGDYRVWLVTPTLEGNMPAQEFMVAAPPGELARTQMDAAELQRVAKISGGRFYTFATAGRLLAELPRGREVHLDALPPTAIWNSPLVAGLFVALLMTEWLLRRRIGML